MDYELAKQLKDAGFNQPIFPRYCANCKKISYGDHDIIDHEDCVDIIEDIHVYIPNLSELIESCGKRFGRLQKEADPTGLGEFFASEHKINALKIFGKTPEEAVAKLWLELNKKDGKENSTKEKT